MQSAVVSRGRLSILGAGAIAGVAVLGLVVACGSSERDGFSDDAGAPDLEGGGFPMEGGFGGDGSGPGLPEGETRDPVDCEEAKTSKSYVGCDYWPTVTANGVWSVFDFAVVVANTQTKDAAVTVTGPNGVNKKVTVPSGQVKKIYLPWVASLKGPDWDECTSTAELTQSVAQPNGAYHLVSDLPVIVYQFNALEYKGAGGENPNGGAKDWSACPGATEFCFAAFGPVGCFSFSNDASLLLPSTAMTGNYRLIAQHGWSELGTAVNGTVAAITATQPQTAVTVTLSASGKVLASQGGSPAVAATNGGGTIKLLLANAGDVVELVTEKGAQFDLGGSLVQADKPVQVIAGLPCINLPAGKGACDHVEETVLPAETLGKHYIVHPPTGPSEKPVQHNVRLYGNKDGTTLTYAPSKPPKCPDTLGAGQVVDCDLVSDAFEVTGNNEFGVATFLLGATVYAANMQDRRGDPDATTFAAVEQFRTKYVFLAPDDYAVSFVDITATEDAKVDLDGKPVSSAWTKIGNGPFGVHRVKLGAGQGGAHTLTSKKPVAIQVVGYGDNTSYHYPGGLNLNLIAPPPPPPK